MSRLTAIKDELAATPVPDRQPLDFSGALGAWNSGYALTRRQLLTELFDAIDVEDEEVVALKPRTDRDADIAEVMEGL